MYVSIEARGVTLMKHKMSLYKDEERDIQLKIVF